MPTQNMHMLCDVIFLEIRLEFDKADFLIL